eukprot:31198-Pelagococcus_subviridis.AAC.15
MRNRMTNAGASCGAISTDVKLADRTIPRPMPAKFSSNMMARYVNDTEQEAEERVHDVLDAQARDVADLLSPRPREEERERDPKRGDEANLRGVFAFFARRPRVVVVRARGRERGGRHERVQLHVARFRDAFDARFRRDGLLRGAIIDRDDVQEVIRGVEVLRDRLPERGEVRAARLVPVALVHRPSSAE